MKDYYEAEIFFPILWEYFDVYSWELSRSLWHSRLHIDPKTAQYSAEVKWRPQ